MSAEHESRVRTDDPGGAPRPTRMRAGDVPDEWNRVTDRIIGGAIEVHRELGPGLLEKFYERALDHELSRSGLTVERQFAIRLRYKDLDLGEQYADLVVNRLVVLEIKAVERVVDVHLSQLTTYLRASGLPLGLLINFNVPRIKDGLFRRVHSIGTPLPRSFSDPLPPPRPSAPSAPSAFSRHA